MPQHPYIRCTHVCMVCNSRGWVNQRWSRVTSDLVLKQQGHVRIAVFLAGFDGSDADQWLWRVELG